MGCIYAEGALLDGNVVETLDGVESAEACCRACRALDSSVCGMWNYCGKADGCRCDAGARGQVCFRR